MGFSIILKVVGKEAGSNNERLDGRILVIFQPMYATDQLNASLCYRGFSIISPNDTESYPARNTLCVRIDHPHRVQTLGL